MNDAVIAHLDCVNQRLDLLIVLKALVLPYALQSHELTCASCALQRHWLLTRQLRRRQGKLIGPRGHTGKTRGTKDSTSVVDEELVASSHLLLPRSLLFIAELRGLLVRIHLAALACAYEPRLAPVRAAHIDVVLLILHSIDESVLTCFSFGHVTRGQLLLRRDYYHTRSRMALELHHRVHAWSAEARRLSGLSQEGLGRHCLLRHILLLLASITYL